MVPIIVSTLWLLVLVVGDTILTARLIQRRLLGRHIFLLVLWLDHTVPTHFSYSLPDDPRLLLRSYFAPLTLLHGESIPAHATPSSHCGWAALLATVVVGATDDPFGAK